MTGKTRPGLRAQLAFHAVLLAASIVMLVEAWRIEGWPQWSSAGVFPLMLAAIMLLSLVWDSVKVWQKAEAAHGKFREYVSGNWWGLTLLTLALVVLLDFAGFLPAAIFFLWSSVFFLHRGKPWFALALALGISAVIYALFTWVFKVNLP